MDNVAKVNLQHFVTTFKLDDSKPIIQHLGDQFRVSYNVDEIFLHVTFKDNEIYTEVSPQLEL